MVTPFDSSKIRLTSSPLLGDGGTSSEPSFRNPMFEGFYDDPTLIADDPRPKLPIVSSTLTGSSVRAEHELSILNAFADGAIAEHHIVPSGPYLDMGRNRAVKQFLTTPHDVLLFVDSDISFTPDDVRRLYDELIAYHAITGVWPILGGVYLGVVGGQREPVAYDWHEVQHPDGTWERQLWNVPTQTILDHDPDDLLEVGAFGTGFMMIHRDVLSNFADHFLEPQTYFAEIVVNGTWFGEDLIFCMRAASLGHPILVAPGVRLPHYKEIGLVF